MCLTDNYKRKEASFISNQPVDAIPLTIKALCSVTSEPRSLQLANESTGEYRAEDSICGFGHHAHFFLECDTQGFHGGKTKKNMCH